MSKKNEKEDNQIKAASTSLKESTLAMEKAYEGVLKNVIEKINSAIDSGHTQTFIDKFYLNGKYSHSSSQFDFHKEKLKNYLGALGYYVDESKLNDYHNSNFLIRWDLSSSEIDELKDHRTGEVKLSLWERFCNFYWWT